MAKNYSAKLSLKDAGMIATLKKAVAETEKLKKNLQQINKTPVKIEAKVGSSFKNVQSQINKVAPKSKTINFTAKEDITRTISQVERSVFEMNKNIGTSMNGITSSINGAFGALPNKISSAMNALNTMSNMSSIARMGMTGAGMLPGMFGAGAGAGIIAAARTTGNQIGTALLGEDAKINRNWRKKWGERFRKIGTVVKAAKGPLNDALKSMADDSKLPANFLTGRIGPEFDKLVQKQMDKLGELDAKRRGLGGGNSNFDVDRLGKYQRMRVPTGPDSDEVFVELANFNSKYAEMLNKLKIKSRKFFDSVEMMALRAFRDPLGTARSLFSSLFSKVKTLSTSAFNHIKTKAVNSFNAVKDTGTRAFNKIKEAGNKFYTSISKGIVGIAARITTLPKFMQGALMSMTRGMASFVAGSKNLLISLGNTASRIGQTISNRLQRAFLATKMTATRVWFAIERGAFGATYRIARSVLKIDKAFSKMKQGASKSFAEIARSGENRFNKLCMYIGRAFNRTFSTIGRGFKVMFTKTVRDSDGTTRTIQRGWVRMASSIARTIGSSIGGAFTKLKSMGLNVAKAIGAAFTAAIGIGIKGMADKEKNLVSIRHFMKVGDAKSNGKRTKDDAQINLEADTYMSNLVDLANNTPFDTFDIFNAGRRGLQVSNGNASQAMDITKLSADMAALNPGKTAQDAMEALADLKLGETERMKEFGFKFSQKDLKAMVGKEEGEDLTDADLEKVFAKLTKEGGEVFKTFNGGAGDLANTLGGKFSTVWGKFKSMMSDAMLPFSDMFKGMLDGAIANIDAFAPKLEASFATASRFIQDLMKGDSSEFAIIDNLLASATALRDGIKPIVDSVMKSFSRMNKSLEDGFGGAGGLIQSISETIGTSLKNLTPFFDAVGTICVEVMDIVASVWPTIEDIIVVASQIIGEACKILDPIIGAIGDVCVAIGNIIAKVWPSVKDTILRVWEVLKPVFELFSDIVQKIANFIADNWPAIATVIEKMWAVAEVPLNLMLGVIEGIAKAVEWAWEKFKGFNEWWNTTNWNPTNWFDTSEGQEKANAYASQQNGAAMNQGRQHATGLDRVPYNGYKATLHEGERVLTARQARQEDTNKNNTASSATNTFNINVNGGATNEDTARVLVEHLKAAFGNANLNPA